MQISPRFGYLFLANDFKTRKGTNGYLDTNPFTPPEKQNNILSWGAKMGEHQNVLDIRNALRSGQPPDPTFIRQKLAEAIAAQPTRMEAREQQEYVAFINTADMVMELSTSSVAGVKFEELRFSPNTKQWQDAKGKSLDKLLKQFPGTQIVSANLRFTAQDSGKA